MNFGELDRFYRIYLSGAVRGYQQLWQNQL